MAVDKKYHRVAKTLSKHGLWAGKTIADIQRIIKANRNNLFLEPVSRHDCNQIGRLVKRYNDS